MKRLCFLIALVVLPAFAACQGGEGSASTPTPAATATPASTQLTPTQPLTTPTLTPAPSPTPTPLPPTPTPAVPATCQAPTPPNIPGGKLVAQGCDILFIAPGGTASVPLTPPASPPPCAAFRGSFAWQVWAPAGASVTVYGMHQGVKIGEISGNSGQAGGYCGSLIVENPNRQSATVHVKYKLYDCSAGTCP